MSPPTKKTFAAPVTSDLDDLAAGVRGRFSGQQQPLPAPPVPVPAVAPAPAVVPSRRHDVTPSPPAEMSKYTVLLDGTDATTYDELALGLRRRTGRRVGKSDILRALLSLARTDQDVAELLAPHLPPPTR